MAESAADIRKRLFSMKDEAFRAFQAKVIPTLGAERIIGVRTPGLRRLATELHKNGGCPGFLAALPHEYFEENQLHAFVIAEEKEFGGALAETERFLPFIDNWATCDQLSPAAFAKNRAALLPRISAWLASGHVYTARFAIGMLMRHFLDEDFSPACLEMVASVTPDEYYLSMMVAWYFATALAKQYDAALPLIAARRLDPWTHNKAIQKACESRRVSAERKEELRRLRVNIKKNG